MKKVVCLLLSMAVFAAVSLISVSCFADDEPSLKQISFKNAQIVGEFSPDVYSYELELDGSGKDPALKSYEIDGEAQIFVTDIYENSDEKTGLSVTLKYGDEKSVIYTFVYAESDYSSESSSCDISDIQIESGELSPAFSADVTEYTLYIPSDLTQLVITPETAVSDAYSPQIIMTLDETQEPTVPVTCTAANGEEKTYTLKLKRSDKTTAQMEAQIKKDGTKGLADADSNEISPETAVIIISAAAGTVVLILIYIFTKRKLINPYYDGEKPFYKE